MDKAVKILLKAGWTRLTDDFDPEGKPRPYLACKHWKAIVGKRFVTFYPVLSPGNIGPVFSEPTGNETGLRVAAERIAA